MKEHQLQKATADFIGWALLEDVIAFHVPNERETAIARMILSGLGVLPGVADWIFLAPRWVGGVEFADGRDDMSDTLVGQAYCIELKTATGKQTEAQLEFQRRCDRIRVPYRVCRTPEEFEATLREWGLLNSRVRLG